MNLSGAFLLVLLLAINCWGSVDARTSVQFGTNSIFSEAVKESDELCTMCEEFTAQASEYLRANKTHTEIIDALHQACAKMPPYEKQCDLLVDYYASIFFIEIDKIRPEDFCRKVNLCGKRIYVDLPMTDEFCSACHDFVAEVISKLDDADAQMEVIVTLLKGCSKLEQHYVKQCKKLVFKYAPLILVNGVKFLQNTDVCNAVHVCPGTREVLVSTA